MNAASWSWDQKISAWQNGFWPRRMTKCKRDIFTVIESVENWFKASRSSTAPTKVPEGVNTNREFGDTDQDPSRPAETAANGEMVKLPALTLSQSTGEVANWPEPTSTGAELTATVCFRGQEDPSEPATPITVEMADSAAKVHQAFWDSLKRAGYEEW